MARAFSGIQPTGELHLGNYLGATRRWAQDQHDNESVFCVVDLHALTSPHDPDALRDRVTATVAILLACGLDPEVCTLFVQSHVAEHSQLAWLMECTVSFGELRRMTQFKEKGERSEFVSAGLFTYPALQAADILLYDTDVVPVGDDQRQHIELSRDIAERFNARFGETFVVPEHVIPPVGARIMDLQEPTRKMSKSVESPQGTVNLLDDPKAIEKKVKRAVTDTGSEVRFDPDSKAGISNLLSILAAVTGEGPEVLAGRYEMYGPLKADVAEAVVELLRPVQGRYRELMEHPEAIQATMAAGAEKATVVARATLARAQSAVGLLPPG